MTDLATETLEGRLIAQRKLLALLVAEVSRAQGAGPVWDWLEERSTMQDHQEDPGAVPSPGVGIEVAIAEEVRRIRDEARRHVGDLRVGEGRG